MKNSEIKEKLNELIKKISNTPNYDGEDKEALKIDNILSEILIELEDLNDDLGHIDSLY